MCPDFLSFLLQWFFPYSLIKYDVAKGEHVRDSAGFCIEAGRGALKTKMQEQQYSRKQLVSSGEQDDSKISDLSCVNPPQMSLAS